MSRPDFRLSKTETDSKIFALSNNPEYKLLWFYDKKEMASLGGIIVHLLEDRIAVAYRCFDHTKTKTLGLEEVDYYAEIKMCEYASSLHYNLLSHGNDKHPVNQVGLSAWKLRIGAKPTRSQSASNDNYSESELLQLALENGVAGYYSDLVGENYTKFHMFGDNRNQSISQFLKIAQNNKIEVIFHTT